MMIKEGDAGDGNLNKTAPNIKRVLPAAQTQSGRLKADGKGVKRKANSALQSN